jgi:sigma-B regulation protein RsbU (phosphoserine phosphatase)
MQLSPLPQSIETLLGSFTASGREIRLWTQLGGRWVCLFPGDTAMDGGPNHTSTRHTVEVADGPPLELEVATGSKEEGNFVAHALGRMLEYEREARSAARELSEKYEEINLLYSISEILGSVLSLETSALRILTEVADLLGARRASLWVYHHDDDQLHLAAAVGEDGLKGPVRVDDMNSATARVFRERQPLNLEQGRAMLREGQPEQLDPAPYGREPFLSVPINYTPPEGGARTVGVINLVGRRSEPRYSAGDSRLLSAIASQVGAALETQRMMQENLRESVKQERVMRELELAHDLQKKLLPDTFEFDGAHEVAARCAPAETVGGDFYHLFRLSNDRLGVMIGDVSGHGFSAALIMALTMSALAIYAQEAGPPADVLRRIHTALMKELETTEMYLSLFYGVLDPNEGRLVYANAGHPHAFCIRGNGEAQRLGATTPPLGIALFDQYAESVIAWQSSEDLLCLFTDGLSDAFHGAEVGEMVVVERIDSARGEPLKDILAQLFALAEQATLSIPPDDRTLVLVRV